MPTDLLGARAGGSSTRSGALLDRAAAPDDTRRRLADLARTLDELFLLVVAGEFNAGKSTVVNALFGRRVMEEGPVPTTDKITVLRHGDAEAVHRRGEFVTERLFPHPFLESLSLVDTPGTNSIVKEHQALTEDFVPRADLVLFVTSYDRPLSDSERTFLEYIRGAWGKRLVVVVNKADLAETEAALAQVLSHVRDGLARIFAEAGIQDAGTGAGAPLIFPVAARLALQAQEAAAGGPAGDDPAALRADPRWEASRFGPFQRFLTETLTEGARLALKLAAPLDAATTLLAGVRQRLDAQREVLAGDEHELAALNARFDDVRESLAEYRRPRRGRGRPRAAGDGEARDPVLRRHHPGVAPQPDPRPQRVPRGVRPPGRPRRRGPHRGPAGRGRRRAAEARVRAVERDLRPAGGAPARPGPAPRAASSTTARRCSATCSARPAGPSTSTTWARRPGGSWRTPARR